MGNVLQNVLLDQYAVNWAIQTMSVSEIGNPFNAPPNSIVAACMEPYSSSTMTIFPPGVTALTCQSWYHLNKPNVITTDVSELVVDDAILSLGYQLCRVVDLSSGHGDFHPAFVYVPKTQECKTPLALPKRWWQAHYFMRASYAKGLWG
jgi:hypothetical protein